MVTVPNGKYRVSYLKPFGAEVVWQCPEEKLPDVEASNDIWRNIVEAMESADGQGLLCLRGLDLSPTELEVVLARLGAIWHGDLLRYDRWPGQSPGVEGCPHLALLGNYKARKENDMGVVCEKGDAIAEFKPASMDISEWHTDGSFLATPKTAIALYAPMIENALPAEGGETRFASCVRALEMLKCSDPALYDRLKTLNSVHSWEVFMRFLEARDPARPKATAEQCAAKPDQAWPIVRSAGRDECLYVNPKNTRCVLDPHGNTVDEGIELVRGLGQRIVDSGVYAHAWRPGDLILWNNTRLLHAATPFDHLTYERLLYRAEFRGEPVFPPFKLESAPDTVCWGYLDPSIKPRLCVPSGAVVSVDTVSGGPEVAPPQGDASWSTIPDELYQIHAACSSDRLGPHILTGPIFVQGAEPGDCLRIDILDVSLRSDWAWTVVPSRTGGGLTMLSGQPYLDAADLDKPRYTRLVNAPGSGWAFPSWGGTLDCAPFFGVLGVAPACGRVNSIPPSEDYGGNLDLKLLTRGATLWLPVQVSGALLFVGDGHARQGDGECCGTALETALTGVFKLSVVKGQTLQAPRAETDRELVTIACQSSIDDAAAAALQRMLEWLAELRPNLSRLDAYCLCSVAADVRVTQFVNGDVRGVHVILNKNHLPPP